MSLKRVMPLKALLSFTLTLPLRLEHIDQYAQLAAQGVRGDTIKKFGEYVIQ